MDGSDPKQPDFLTPYFPTEAEDPRRREPRRRTFLGGKLVFGPHDLTADCAIRNLTAHGAKIQTTVAPTLTREMWLIVVKHGRVYRASLAWRRGEDVGLKFEAEHDLTDNRDPALAVVRHVWRQVSAR